MTQHARDIVRVVLEIGVHDHHPTPLHRLEAGIGGRGLARVGLEPDEPRTGILLVEAAHDLGTPIAAAVVNEDRLVVEPGGIQHFADLGPEHGQVLFFVVNRNDDGEVDRAQPAGPRGGNGAHPREGGSVRRLVPGHSGTISWGRPSLSRTRARV